MSAILLVEDDADLRVLLRTALAAHALEVYEADTLAAADALLAHAHVDLVVVDGLLPDGSGVDFIARLRTERPNARVVFLSAHVRDLGSFRRLTTELGVLRVVYKPIDVANFARRIAKLVPPGDEASEEGDGTEYTSFIAELARIRRSYVRSLPDRLTEIELLLAAARADPSLLVEVRGLAHRLRGSAGSYGCEAIGEEMGRLEDLLATFAKGEPPERFFWEQLDGVLRDARTATPGGVESILDRPSSDRARPLLVVDNDPDVLAFVAECGRRMSVRVLGVQTAAEAVQRAEGQPLLSALIDTDHSELGRALARRLHGTPGNADLPIAFMSADHRMEMRLAALASGAMRFLEKPLTWDSFAKLAQQLSQATHQYRVLIVDDDPDMIVQYRRHLSIAGIAVDALTSAERLFEHLDRALPDLLILDVNLPCVSGIDACRALRMSSQWELLPILIATVRTDSSTRLDSYRAGASDVVTKPILPEELLARATVQLERARLLRERADTDPLTGLMLRRAFLEAVQRDLASAAREHRPLSLILFDIDHFKQINDTHGHLAGDGVLASLGRLLQRRFRVEDLRGRWGGEEFVLAFSGQGAAFAEGAAMRLLEEFSAMRFLSDDGAEFSATFTAGVVASPEDGGSIHALLRRADEMLYAGKHAGRNLVMCSKRQGGSR